MIEGKTIVLGVTGSIAAYKAADLASKLVQAGADVRVVLTENGRRFVTETTFTALTGHPAVSEMFDRPYETGIKHISLADIADLILIAPASANVIGKIACGIADDLLTTTVMSAAAPCVIAPAMNVRMYENPIVQENIKKLQGLGYHFVEPESGHLACGTVGKGRLASLEVIQTAVENILGQQGDLSGMRILVTAGPTREPLDPVRYLSNYSSGKMGYAVAEAAASRGAKVTLISGPTSIAVPRETDLVPVETSAEMETAALKEFDHCDVAICVAAVADYRPAEVASQKIKKSPDSNELILRLEKTPDILGELGNRKKSQILVGFAAETENLLQNAEKKLRDKYCDLLVANDVTAPEAGFGSETNLVTLLAPGQSPVSLPKMLKREVANAILDKVLEISKLPSH